MAGGGIKINNIKVSGGADGATFIPSVDSSGTLSWTNNKGYENPIPVNLKGADGKDGVNGKDGATGAKLISQVLQGQDENGGNIYLQTFDDGTTAYFTAPKGKDADLSNLENFVKFDDIPSGEKAGVVKQYNNNSEDSGLDFLYDGSIKVAPANVEEIAKKTNSAKPIVPLMVDDAVLQGVAHNKIEQSEDEKNSSCEWMGAVRKTGDTMSGGLRISNYRSMDELILGVDGVRIGNEDNEVHYGKSFIFQKYFDTETINGLPTESGTLATEDKARSIAIEEIAKSTGIDSTLFVKFTDYASSGKAGVVKTQAFFGVNTNQASGNLEIAPAEQKDILAKTNAYKPIVSTTNDYAVKVGITTNTETLTAEEKANACEWLGALPLSGGTLTGEITLAQGDGKGIDLGKAGVINSGDNTVLGFLNNELMIGTYNNQTILRTKKGTKLKVQFGSPSAGTLENMATESYVDTNKGTKLYKHTITGFVGGTGVIDITSITLISTSNTEITFASNLDLQYTQYVVTANTAYGKVVNIVQTKTDEITMQFHNRLAGGEVETVVLDASSITDNVEGL